LRHGEILSRLRICLQALSVGFVKSEAIECNQTPSHVVRAFIRKKISDQVASSSRNDTTQFSAYFLKSSRWNGSIW
jgi:hypothetical protein